VIEVLSPAINSTFLSIKRRFIINRSSPASITLINCRLSFDPPRRISSRRLRRSSIFHDARCTSFHRAFLATVLVFRQKGCFRQKGVIDPLLGSGLVSYQISCKFSSTKRIAHSIVRSHFPRYVYVRESTATEDYLFYYGTHENTKNERHAKHENDDRRSGGGRGEGEGEERDRACSALGNSLRYGDARALSLSFSVGSVIFIKNNSHAVGAILRYFTESPVHDHGALDRRSRRSPLLFLRGHCPRGRVEGGRKGGNRSAVPRTRRSSVDEDKMKISCFSISHRGSIVARDWKIGAKIARGDASSPRARLIVN